MEHRRTSNVERRTSNIEVLFGVGFVLIVVLRLGVEVRRKRTHKVQSRGPSVIPMQLTLSRLSCISRLMLDRCSSVSIRGFMQIPEVFMAIRDVGIEFIYLVMRNPGPKRAIQFAVEAQAY